MAVRLSLFCAVLCAVITCYADEQSNHTARETKAAEFFVVRTPYAPGSIDFSHLFTPKQLETMGFYIDHSPAPEFEAIADEHHHTQIGTGSPIRGLEVRAWFLNGRATKIEVTYGQKLFSDPKVSPAGLTKRFGRPDHGSADGANAEWDFSSINRKITLNGSHLTIESTTRKDDVAKATAKPTKN
jgi:hypothetical protein